MLCLAVQIHHLPADREIFLLRGDRLVEPLRLTQSQAEAIQRHTFPLAIAGLRKTAAVFRHVALTSLQDWGAHSGMPPDADLAGAGGFARHGSRSLGSDRG